MRINEIVIIPTALDLKRDTINDLVNYFRTNDIYWGCRFYFKNTKYITRDELMQVLNHFENQIEGTIVRWLVDGSIGLAFAALCYLRKVDTSWSWIDAILLRYKREIIKLLLNMIKEGQYNTLSDDIDIALDSNLDWPELKTIKKSLDHLKAQEINEDANSKMMDMIYKQVKHRFTYSFWAAMQYLTSHCQDPSNWVEMKELITHHKKQIISTLLKTLTDERFDSYTISSNLELIKQLHQSGITWPELNTIKNSLEHDAKLRGLV